MVFLIFGFPRKYGVDPFLLIYIVFVIYLLHSIFSLTDPNQWYQSSIIDGNCHKVQYSQIRWEDEFLHMEGSDDGSSYLKRVQEGSCWHKAET